MRILILNQYFPPDASATAYLLGELTEDLAAAHEIWVVAGRPSYNPESSTFVPSGPRVVRAWSTSFDRSRTAGRAFNYASFLVSSGFRALAVPRPDLVMCLTDPPVIGVIAAITAWRHRRPFLFVCHDVYPDIALALGRMRSRPLVWVWRRLNRAVRRRASRIVVVGRDMQEKLADEGVEPDKLRWLPNWASAPALAPGAAQAVRASMGWEDRFVVMHAGNVGLAQQLGTLVDAAGRLRHRPDILIVILGDGAAKGGLQDAVRTEGLDNVVFVSYRAKDEAESWMAAADLHVVSLAPGLGGCAAPSKLYSIMAAGRPFVAAVDPGSEPDRVARETGCGVRVPAGDGQALAEAIAAVTGEMAADMGRRGREEFERRYDRGVVTAGYRLLLEEMGAAGRST